MIKIGAFSRISQVPTKTLRYYDEIGLLTPAHVDGFTGYRYYEVDQIVRLNKILALKDLGFALEQIARLLDDDLSVEQMQGMLKLKRAEIESSLAEERGRLARVEARLKALTEGTMADYEVVLKDTGPTRVAAVRGVIPNYGSLGMLFQELFTELGR